MTHELYNFLLRMPPNKIQGKKLLITGYIRSGASHGATDAKASSVGRVVEAIRVVSSSSSIQVYISGNRHHFHYSEIEFIPDTNKHSKVSDPSKLEYDLKSSEQFFLKNS